MSQTDYCKIFLSRGINDVLCVRCLNRECLCTIRHSEYLRLLPWTIHTSLVLTQKTCKNFTWTEDVTAVLTAIFLHKWITVRDLWIYLLQIYMCVIPALRWMFTTFHLQGDFCCIHSFIHWGCSLTSCLNKWLWKGASCFWLKLFCTCVICFASVLVYTAWMFSACTCTGVQ